MCIDYCQSLVDLNNEAFGFPATRYSVKLFYIKKKKAIQKLLVLVIFLLDIHVCIFEPRMHFPCHNL